MNADRRKKITELAGKLGDIRDAIGALKDEEQEAHDALPDSLQQGEKGEAMETAVSSLESAESSCDDAVTSLEEIE